jgi:outer membrane protein assembly factor BamB
METMSERIRNRMNKLLGERILMACALCLALPAAAALGADWPQFQGPERNGISPETGLMKTWPEGGPPVLWTVELGPGFGGPCVHDGKVYILDRVEGEQDVLRCIDLESGREDWRFAYEAKGKISYPGSRSHPSVDEKHVFILGPFGDFHCVSRKTGKPVWRKNILEDFDGKKPNWAVSQAPLLYKDKVIVAPIGKKAGMVALKKGTGAVAWKSPSFEGGMTYASPMIAEIGGRNHVMMITTEWVLGVDADTGRLLWNTGDWKCKIPIASPAPLGNGLVLVTGGYGAGAAMLKVEKKGNGRFEASTLFKTRSINGQIHQPLFHEGHLYMNGNDKSKRHGLLCADLEGNVKWQTGRDPGFDWGGLLLADGMIYTVDGNRGDLCMVAPDPSGYREAGRFNLLSGEQIWGTIALADGRILVRDQKQMKCVDVRRK